MNVTPPPPRKSRLAWLLLLGAVVFFCSGGMCLVTSWALLTDDEVPVAPMPPETPEVEAEVEVPAEGAQGTWACTASGWVQVCRMGGVCSNMLVSGTGVGPDQLAASQMATTACRGNIVAAGGMGTCSVACAFQQKE